MFSRASCFLPSMCWCPTHFPWELLISPPLLPRVMWKSITQCPEKDSMVKAEGSREKRSPQWVVPQFLQLTKED